MKLKNIVKSSILEIISTLLFSACIVKKVDKKLNELVETIFVHGKNNYGPRR